MLEVRNVNMKEIHENEMSEREAHEEETLHGSWVNEIPVI